MMGLFGKILKTGLDLVTSPIAVIKDVANFGETDHIEDKAKAN